MKDISFDTVVMYYHFPIALCQLRKSCLIFTQVIVLVRWEFSFSLQISGKRVRFMGSNSSLNLAGNEG